VTWAEHKCPDICLDGRPCGRPHKHLGLHNPVPVVSDYVRMEEDGIPVESLPVRETAITPGIYRHYKGPLYVVLGLARHHETDERGVVYHGVEPHGREVPMWNWRPLYGPGGWFTPLTAEELTQAVQDKLLVRPSVQLGGPRFTFLYRVNSTQVERTFVD
jgi:hypothetical protein